MNFNNLPVFCDVVPLPKRVPARRDHLNQNFSHRNAGYLHAAVLIGLEIEFGAMDFVQHLTRSFVVAHVNAGIAQRLVVVARGDQDSQPGVALARIGFGVPVDLGVGRSCLPRRIYPCSPGRPTAPKRTGRTTVPTRSGGQPAVSRRGRQLSRRNTR